MLPFLIAYILELFVLPIDFFTFRCWEALKIGYFVDALGGPFYPNMRLSRIEVGDIGSKTIWGEKKHVTWVTDSYGFRFDEKNKVDNYDIVIVGDSFVVGTSVSQEDMLDRQLSKLTGKSIYPYAPYKFNEFMEDNRFIGNMPSVIIYAISESYIRTEDDFLPDDYYRSILRCPPKNYFIRGITVSLDRFSKQIMIYFYQSRAQELLFKIYKRYIKKEKIYVRNSAIVSRDGEILFHNYEFKSPAITKEKTAILCKRLIGYKSFVERNGSRFIVIPIPFKSTIYYDRVPMQYPEGLEIFINTAISKGLNVVNIIPEFLNVKNKRMLYQKDDTHLNNHGIFVLSNILARSIK